MFKAITKGYWETVTSNFPPQVKKQKTNKKSNVNNKCAVSGVSVKSGP